MADISVGDIKARITLDNKDFKNKMADARKEVQKTQESTHKSKEAFDLLGHASHVAGLAVAGAIGASIKVAADFETAMARVRALTGASDMEFKQLSDTAVRLGKETMFSAQEAADAMGYLASAGFKTNDIIGAMPAVLNLAAASQMDLGRSSEIVGNIMNNFGLKANDVGHAVDILTKAAIDSNAELPDMAEAMKYAAPVAHSLKYSIEETASAIGILSNEGIKGSQAGTSLRHIMLALSNPLGRTKKAMQELGISFKDSHGELLPLSDIIGVVSKRLDGMTQAQKVQYASMLVGTESSSAFISLLDQGKGKIDDFTDSLKNSGGTAKRVADMQMNTLNGQIKSFKGSLEELGVVTANTFLPQLTDMVKGLIAFTNSLNNIDPRFLALGLKVAGIASGIGIAVSWVYKFKDAFIAAGEVLGKMTPWGRILTIALALAPAIIGVVDALNIMHDVNTNNLGKMMTQQRALDDQIKQYKELKSKMKLSNDEIALYLDYQKRVSTESKPDVIAAYGKLMDDLRKRSGLSNEQFDKFIGLNNKIASQVPSSVVGYTKLGNAIVGSTDKLDAYNAALVRRIQLEYETDRQTIEDNITKKLQEQKDLQDQFNTDLNNRNALMVEIVGKQKQINDLEQKLKDKRLSNDEKQKIQDRINEEKRYLGVMNNTLAARDKDLVKQSDEIKKTEDAIAKEQQKFNKIKQTYLAQVGLTAEQGKEVKAINDAVTAQQKVVSELEQKVKKDGKVTDAEKEQVKAAQEKLDKLKDIQTNIQNIQKDQDKVTDKIRKSTGEAKGLQDVLTEPAAKEIKFTGNPMDKALSISKESAKTVSKYVQVDDKGRVKKINDDLGAPIRKTISVYLNKIGNWLGLGDRHTGGTVHELPKFHSGGNVNLPIAASRPKFDEVDVRLLRNEMVLTTAQQANLFRMIDTFSEIARRKLIESSETRDGTIYNTTINVESLVVREEADIKRISEKLDELARQRQRARGEY